MAGIVQPGTDVTIAAGHAVEFAGDCTDPDGDSPLTHLWAYGGGAPDDFVQNPGAVTFGTPGTYGVTYRCTDPEGAWDEAPLTVTVNGVPGDVVHVSADAPPGGDGASWETAFRTVQQGMDAAIAGQQVWVAEGRYTGPAAREPVLVMKDGVSVYGGFAGTEGDLSERPDPVLATVLSGDFNGDDGPEPADFFEFLLGQCQQPDNSLHVVVAASDATLDGLVVTGGNTISWDIIPWNPYNYGGGGIFISGQANLAIRNSQVLWNCIPNFITSGGLGSGIYAEHSDVSIEHTRILNNLHNGIGGAVGFVESLVRMDQLTISRNYAYVGGAISVDRSEMELSDSLLWENITLFDINGVIGSDSVVQIRRTVIGNYSMDDGPEVYLWSSGDENYPAYFEITDSALLNPSTDDGEGGYDCPVPWAFYACGTGGGILIENHPGLIDRVIISRKYSETHASAVQVNDHTGIKPQVVVINSTFYENSNVWTHGTVGVSNAELAISSSTFYGDYVLKSSGDGTLTVSNSAFWHGGGVGTLESYGSSILAASYNCAGEPIPGTGNILLSADPFIRAASGELYLDPASPCVDAGSDGLADDPDSGFPAAGLDWRNLTTRMDGSPDTGTVDMGRHHDPAAVVVLTFGAGETELAWTTRNADGCRIESRDDSFLYDVPPGDLDAGSTSHGQPPGTAFTIRCTGLPYPAVARATAP
ncbi:MAG: right-handed parallel beta-helix repeat-containing protein [Deltaproteobacteria bacterium]|nr:right-handed parallel beta-helix repeat-containing protein [Deltaproteobacteria bacterium]